VSKHPSSITKSKAPGIGLQCLQFIFHSTLTDLYIYICGAMRFLGHDVYNFIHVCGIHYTYLTSSGIRRIQVATMRVDTMYTTWVPYTQSVGIANRCRSRVQKPKCRQWYSMWKWLFTEGLDWRIVVIISVMNE